MRFRYLSHHYEFPEAHYEYMNTLTHRSLLGKEGYKVIYMDINQDSVYVVYRKER